MSEENGGGGVEVVKYDRALLEKGELQPVATMDGHTIVVNRYGTFTAQVGDVNVAEDTLEAAKEKVHSAHLASLKKSFRPVACYIYDRDFFGSAFFRGVHAGNGRLLWSAPDGTKYDGPYAKVFAPDDPRVEELDELAKRRDKLQEEVARLGSRISEIVDGQAEKMYGDLGRTGWSGSFSGGPRIRNDAEKAAEVHAAIIENVLRGESDG